MYFRASMRHNPRTGELSGYYRLVESYRNRDNRICHRTMLSAGFLDELSGEQLKKIQQGLSMRIEGIDNTLFHDEPDPVVSSYIEWIELVKAKVDSQTDYR